MSDCTQSRSSIIPTDDVAAAYAATYPVALVLIVLVSNLIGTFIP